MSQPGSKPGPPMGGIESENLSGPHQFMHSAEMIVFLNSKRMSARASNLARLTNAGSAGNHKASEKIGGPLTPASWIEDGEWEARKKKRKRRSYGY